MYNMFVCGNGIVYSAGTKVEFHTWKNNVMYFILSSFERILYYKWKKVLNHLLIVRFCLLIINVGEFC